MVMALDCSAGGCEFKPCRFRNIFEHHTSSATFKIFLLPYYYLLKGGYVTTTPGLIVIYYKSLCALEISSSVKYTIEKTTPLLYLQND